MHASRSPFPSPLPGRGPAAGAEPPSEGAALPRVPGPRPEPTQFSGLLMGRGRPRAVAHIDAVVFTARCPACGADCQWTEEREDTRIRAIIDCTCSG